MAKFEGKIKDPSKEIEELRNLVARLSMITYRLAAEADLHYPPKHPVLEKIQGYHTELQDGMTTLTHHLVKEQEEWDSTSVNGRLARLELERRQANAGARLAKIISLEEYRATHNEPKGAA